MYLIVLAALVEVSCSDSGIDSQPPVSAEETEAPFLPDAISGELLIKFKPEMTDILDRIMATTRAAGSERVMTRSGIPSTDEILEILGGYHFERVFPIDEKNEERTRAAGLHLWYLVKFDEHTDLKKAVSLFSKLGEIANVQGNSSIKRSYNPENRRIYINETALKQKALSRSNVNNPFNDPCLSYQWHYNNMGNNAFDDKNDLNNSSVADCDVGCFEAWKKCTGDPSIIVAVLDEGVMYTHPDLKDNMWVNEGEELYAKKDADGNGYIDDKYGYNFVSNTGSISCLDEEDTGHGTHIAGTIAAMNNNNEGVCGIAGGNGHENPGVRIMSCQVFSGASSVTLDGEARAIKYAADNGAVILQCSWGYNSAEANVIEGYIPGPSTEKEWSNLYPLEKDALDYFINNAGSPNGVIDGGIAVFAAGNEYAGIPSYPGAYSKCVVVSAVAADFTPSSYTNFGVEVDVCAPGGDMEYYGVVGKDDPEFWTDDEYCCSILSTLIQNGQPAYGYMEGTSMACPHVAGVAALGLSYALQQRRHFKASEFVVLLKKSVKPVDSRYSGKKVYYRNHLSVGASPTQMDLSNYIGKMGTGLVDAALLLNNIEGSGADMKVPNIYVAEGGKSIVDLACYFVKGDELTYTCTSSDVAIATVAVNNTVMEVSGVKTGTTHITVKVSNGSEQTIAVTVRKNANDNGWM